MITDPSALNAGGLRSQWLAGYQPQLRISEIGKLAAIGDGIAWIEGLPSAAMDQILRFENGSEALVFHLGSKRIGAILLGQEEGLAAGAAAHLTGRRLDIGVGDGFLGRVVDPLGNPLDGGPQPKFTRRRALEVPSPPITARDFVRRPLLSGSKMVDTMIPIGKGQRQLIIGDAGTGKSSLAMDTIIAQKGRDVLCVYVLISQKRSAVVATIETLRQAGVLDISCVVVAEATTTPGLKFLAPFAGCALAEEWMWGGRDVLVVYDDLTTHARAYRELSLLLRRPPGREAYPGDIFYLHARLLERSTCLASRYGSGSMTALPIVETEQGEIAAYIPTNLISITDGQIYLDPALYARGFLPAIDITRSVSRIGGKAQLPAIKAEAGRMKLDFLQFLELEVFTRFGSRLEAGVDAKIQRGRLLRELLKQERLAPLSPEQHLAWLVAYNEGAFDALAGEAVQGRLARLLHQAAAGGPGLAAGRDAWRDAVAGWLQEACDEPPA
ncbi:MAG: F0F1 ATP synthase subunit alpha [Candidatus Accumulibacter phosphatis]|uniref:ATP synthase subunit alpha n=1 Tax=Candidatus Accumulibacter contiguus TaxID=2954381 RepID=A0ABX1TG04_9PROT|nr:F0F1 ATP synthase subunit alpha [Candidatus Accumulibacter contiguus]MBL8408393.1 F0F1 ATP synthase subunit alpha [Accumulibacter sp.]NMQ07391.1 F0F1 ATP synthase subunit alpha [Candidatus Accumulibacter contiguus]